MIEKIFKILSNFVNTLKIHKLDADRQMSAPRLKRLCSLKDKIFADSSSVFIALGALVLFIAGGITAYILIDDYFAGRRAQLLLEEMIELTYPAYQFDDIDFPINSSTTSDSIAPVTNPESNTETASVASQDGTQTNETEPTSPTSAATAKPQPVYDVIGVLTIPKIKIELPVLNKCTKSLLKVSVCRYMGSARETPRYLAIAGHSNKKHFGKLPKLIIGDEVYFTNANGNQYCYTVIDITEVSMYDNSLLTQRDWDIAMFTCNYNGTKRILVRCAKVPEIDKSDENIDTHEVDEETDTPKLDENIDTQELDGEIDIPSLQ